MFCGVFIAAITICSRPIVERYLAVVNENNSQETFLDIGGCNLDKLLDRVYRKPAKNFIRLVNCFFSCTFFLLLSIKIYQQATCCNECIHISPKRNYTCSFWKKYHFFIRKPDPKSLDAKNLNQDDLDKKALFVISIPTPNTTQNEQKTYVTIKTKPHQIITQHQNTNIHHQ